MSPTPDPSQDRNYSFGFQEIDPNNSKHFLSSQLQEEQAIVASIDELSESTYRSPSQQSAVETLRDFEDSRVLRLLSIIRQPGHAHKSYPEGLSNEQFDALFHLKFCPDSHVLLWLGHCRVGRSDSRNPNIKGLPTPQSAVPSSPKQALRRPLRTNCRPLSTFPGHLPAYGSPITHNTTRNSLGGHHFLRNSSRQLFTQDARPSRVTNVQPYWCVNMSCDKYRDRYIYTTCDGWKRHMKEHETVWPCMPYGPLETVGIGLICALCGSINPNENHMAGHSIGDCGNPSTKIRGVSRRVNLERHLLRSHAVSDDCTRGLADRWKSTLRKKYFACGFCVCIFFTIHEQLNHIDMDHFKKGQRITEWSATNVIRGLLLSPQVASLFQCILSSDPSAIDRELHWDWRMIEDLQRRLEMGEDAAEILAFEAYAMLTFNLSRQNFDGQHPPTIMSGPKFVGQSRATMDPLAVSAASLEKNGELQVKGLVGGLEYPLISDEYHVAAPNSSHSRPNYGSPTNQSDTSKAQPSMEGQGTYPIARRTSKAGSASSATQSQPVNFPVQTGSASDITERSSTSTYDSSNTSTQWQPALSTTPSSLHSAEAADMHTERRKIHPAPVHSIEIAGTQTSDLDDRAQSSSLDAGPFPFDTCDPRDLIKKSR